MVVTAHRRLLFVHAHPDDESIANGATMARYVAEQAHVSLVTCTRGELGEVIPVDLAHLAADAQDRLGEHRVGELAAAMAALGVTEYRFLDEVDAVRGPVHYRDSGMIWGPDGRAHPAPDTLPGAFALADVEDAAARLAAVVREVRPQVVVTYDPDGGYGHPDHVQAHRVTMRAVELAAEPADSGRGGRPWSVAKVYWTVPPEQAASTLVTAAVDGTAYLAAKAEAMRAHATQLTVDGATFALSNKIVQPLVGVERYRLVRGVAGEPKDANGLETDLFAGLDSREGPTGQVP